MIDAEEYEVQFAIDSLALEMMRKFNIVNVIVYNTIQLYRWERIQFIKSLIKKHKNSKFKFGFKLVRGAYMEKERDLALKEGYKSPICQTKTETDSSSLDLQETVSMEENDEIGEGSSEGEIEYFPKIENNNFIEEYKSFTKDYDEVINANELCDQKELEKLRYNKIVIATDADVDGMHIRLLLITFFLQFFPELIKEGHVFILQTPLFRVRNKKETIYCYSEEERVDAIHKLSPKPEITRFKGLGEISPNEFKNFIGENIRLDPVIVNKETSIESLLSFYMGKNTPDRQNFIIENLKFDLDKA